MAISSIGVGSGLPLEELLADLRKSENYALSAIQSRQIQAENRLSAYGILKNSIEALQTAAKALTSDDTYGALKTSVTGDAFTASANAKAIPGEYSIHVEKLATSQTVVTNGVADPAIAIESDEESGGVITITLNDADQTKKTIDLLDTGTSLNDIVKAINADKDLGFNATLINDGTGAAPYRLLLTATETGEQAAATSIEVAGNSKLQDLLGFTDADNDNVTIQAASDAHIRINTIDIFSAGNTIENAIEGVTLTLNTTTTDASKLSVTTNDSVTSNAIKKFVSAYNDLQDTIKSLTSYDVENQRSSALTGDSLARRVQSDVRNSLSVVAPDSVIHSLAQLGITTNVTTGHLDIDDAKLTEALKDNMGDVRNLLAGTDGLGSRMITVADRFNSSGGLIGNTTEGINKSITDLQRQYDVTAERIDAKMEAYRRQFTALDSLVAQMSSVSSYLTQQLSMLGNLGKDQ